MPKKPRERTSLDADQVDGIAATMEYLAKRYRDVAQTMRSSGIQKLSVGGFKTLARARYYLQGASKALQDALDEAMSQSPVWNLGDAAQSPTKQETIDEFVKDARKAKGGKKAKG